MSKTNRLTNITANSYMMNSVAEGMGSQGGPGSPEILKNMNITLKIFKILNSTFLLTLLNLLYR